MKRFEWLILGVLLLAAAVAWHDLGAHEVLGRDENATIAKLDQPSLAAVLRAVPMKITGQPGNMQPLYFVLQSFLWPLVGRSAFVLRFLPAAFGILAVAVTFKLGEALFSREAGLAGALFTALLPLHVQYSQIARPYTLLALLSLASAYFLLRAWATDRPIHWAAFALTGALNFYTHYNALFVLAAEAVFVAIVWLARLVRVWQGRVPAGRLAGAVAGFLALGLLCAPGLVQLARLPWTGLEAGAQAEAELGAAVAIELTSTFITRFLARIGLAPLALRVAMLGLAALGLVSTLARRRWTAAVFAILWIALPFLILAVMRSPRPFVERYVIFVPPMALLLAGEGLSVLASVASAASTTSRRLHPAGRRLDRPWLRPALVLALAAVLALLQIKPLRSYYVANRTANRLGEAVSVVERHARAGDAVLVSPRFLVRPLAADGADVHYLPRHLSLAELDQLAGRYQRVWLLFSSYLPPAELQEPVDRWYQARQDSFARVPIKAITALAYSNLTLTDPEASLLDRIVLLEELAASDEKQEAYLRHQALADAYQALSQVYAAQNKPELMAEYQALADAARAAAPPPW